MLKRLLSRIVISATLITAGVISAAGQSPRIPPPSAPAQGERFEPIAEEFHRRQTVPPTGESRSGPAREDRVLKNGLLAPSVQDRADHAAFLKQRHTGLVKLLPREVYDWRTYRTEKRLEIRGGGAYYSFFHLSHEYGYGSDLELDHNKFSVGFAGVDYGMMVNLGDVPLEDLATTDSRAAFIATYEPARNEPDARLEYRRFRHGVTVSGLLHKSSLPVQINSTYLLRSISPRRSDLLVGFRVIRQETDGSVIIAWKRLRQWSQPDLIE